MSISYFNLKDWSDFEQKYKDWIIRDGSAVIESSNLDEELDWTKQAGRWMYRSKDRKSTGEINTGSFMLNKKWTLEEEFNNHIMWFQQVTKRFIYFSMVYFEFLGCIDCQ